jgi:hypothetical protein
MRVLQKKRPVMVKSLEAFDGPGSNTGASHIQKEASKEGRDADINNSF